MLKTESPYYNEADYIEYDGSMRELTVTITLGEYRDLLRENAELTQETVKLKEQVKVIRSDFDRLCKLYFGDDEEIKISVRKIISSMSDLFSEKRQKEKQSHDK